MKKNLSRFKRLRKFKTRLRPLLLYLTTLIVFAIGLFVFWGNLAKKVEAVWPAPLDASAIQPGFDDSWSYRKAITVTVPSNAADVTEIETLIQ